MTIPETKQFLTSLSGCRERIKLTMVTAEQLSDIGCPAESMRDEVLSTLCDQLTAGMTVILSLPDPDESRVLIARYIDGQPYELLSEHRSLQGMSQRSACRLLSRATVHLAELPLPSRSGRTRRCPA